jgi:hypothetical protein
MSNLGYVLTAIIAVWLWVLPRRLISLPFLAAVAYLPTGQELVIGSLHFPGLRIMIAIGFLRMLIKGERMAGNMVPLDTLMVLWAIWAATSSCFHVPGIFITRLGEIFTDLGTYLLFRVYIQEVDDIIFIFKAVCIVFVPVAIAMLYEKATGLNVFALLFGGIAEVGTRHGHVRGHGPFGHPIMAGTVGAACLPMALSFWPTQRRLAVLGSVACGAIVFASGSSGPVMTVMTVLLGLALWPMRKNLRAIRWMAVFTILALNIVMNDPVYYLVGRIDITGGSTGYFRAALIRSAIEHVGEWWLIGTDYTKHWMTTGVPWSSNHTDIVNHYIAMGVWGGLPLMLLFISILVVAFSVLGKEMQAGEGMPSERQFVIWTLGVILFSHAVTFLSVCYFDQSVFFIYILLASIGSIQALRVASPRVADGQAVLVAQDFEPSVHNSQ